MEFSIAFEFANRLLQGAAGTAFEKVMLKMTDAFEARAAALSRTRVQRKLAFALGVPL